MRASIDLYARSVPSLLPKIVASIAEQAIKAFDLAGELRHPGESGRAREATIRWFLDAILPPDFGIDTGFVIDAAGGVSRQIDIVIYRKQRAPVLDIGGVKHFMTESVAAVIETKAVIQSRSVLNSALDNIASVKALDRTNGGTNHLAGWAELVDANEFRHQVWGAVITGRSMKYGTCLAQYVDWLETRPRTLWPNEYVDIHEFALTYVSGISRGSSPTERASDPMTAQGVSGFQPWQHPWGLQPTLAYLGVDLLNFLRVTPLIDFSPYGYFHSTALPMPTYFEFPDDFGTGQSGAVVG